MITVGAKIRILRPCAMGIIPKGAEGTVTAIRPNRVPAFGDDMVVCFPDLGRKTGGGKDSMCLNIASWEGHYEEVR